MDELDFSEDEIKEQLEKLGYKNVSESRLKEFKRDLERLVQHERSKNSSCSTGTTTNNDTGLSSTDVEVEPGAPSRQYRHPLDDAANVHTFAINPSAYEHSRYGKENGLGNVYQSNILQSNVKFALPTYKIAPINLTQQTSNEEMLRRPTSAPADTSLDTTTSSERRAIKRKVVRRRDGRSFYEESILDSEIDDLSSMQDALERLQIPDYSNQGPSLATSHTTYRRPNSAQSEPVYRLPDDYNGPTSLIRPMTANPHTKNIRKSDPVSLYQQYRQSWTSQKAPGEKHHKNLRWSVREHMLYHDEVVQKKQHKVGASNNYVIPSDKKRKNLRWQIRQDLAQGIKPPSIFD